MNNKTSGRGGYCPFSAGSTSRGGGGCCPFSAGSTSGGGEGGVLSIFGRFSIQGGKGGEGGRCLCTTACEKWIKEGVATSKTPKTACKNKGFWT